MNRWKRHIDILINRLLLMRIILGLCETEKETLEEAARILEANKDNLKGEFVDEYDA